MRRRWLLLVLVLFAGAASPAFFAHREDPRLAAWTKQASQLRGLAFEAPVRLRWFSQAEVKDVIREELDGVYTPESARSYRDAYAALGVFPPGLDLVETMLTLQSQAIAGMYSPRRKTLYVLDSLRDDASGADPGQSLIVVHELVHALQDQHFPESLALLTGLRGQDDVVGALSSALEGDATFTMLGVHTEANGTDARSEATAALVRDNMLAELTRKDGAFAAAPRLLRESLIFPYAQGTPLAARSFAREGTAGLDANLREPPLSTRQVLAPDDTAPVEFVRLPTAELVTRLARSACRAGDENVAGALTLQVLFDEYGEAAEGDALWRSWRGDRFAQIDCGDSWELVWLTRWDSAEAATRFATAYRAIAHAVAANAKLAGAPEVVVRDRTALVVTPALRDQAEWILDASEIRAYASFAEWRRDDCFPESPCPIAPAN
jgi:hypothetical protein